MRPLALVAVVALLVAVVAMYWPAIVCTLRHGQPVSFCMDVMEDLR